MIQIQLKRTTILLAIVAVLTLGIGASAADRPWVSLKLYDGGSLEGQWFGYIGFTNELIMEVGSGHLMRVKVDDLGPDNCPGGGDCDSGDSNRWEVQISHGAGIQLGWELFIGIGTPGIICQSETDGNFSLVQDCPATLYLASGPATGDHTFAVEYLTEDTMQAPIGACCGDWPDPGCVEVTADQCIDLGGTWQGEGVTCASAGCGPEIDNVPSLNVLGLALLATLLVGGGLVYMRSRRREDV